MPCYKPLKGYRSRSVNPDTGRRSIVFTARDGLVDQPIDLPCGQCIGCRLERSRQWAIRCVHEASLYERNCFLTLTYDDRHLPPGGSLVKKDFQDFMKRLRFHHGAGIRFFHCGEYGERFLRPHYHACIFNFDFRDKVLFRMDRGVKLYRSEVLEDLWQKKGFCTVGDVTFESAAYVARYCTKKVTGPRAFDHYHCWDRRTGEIFVERLPEYTTMSRRPGLGKGWFDKYSSDVFPSDQVVLRGKAMKAPKFYSRLFELSSALPSSVIPCGLRFTPRSSWDKVRRKRIVQAVFLAQEEPWYRLAVREEVHELQFKLLKRGYEYAPLCI